ncbi:MAG: rhomboid family intramembrane serine protease [Candidatus Rokuibacteriota bacterium]|nr:MAG: rhomboid family intramembrane serine protease [Candidatus Rokubacteria bacterium]
MFPLKDDVPSRSFPLVTVALIVVNVLVYLYEAALGFDPIRGARLYEAFVLEFGLVPCRLTASCPPALSTALAGAPDPWLTVLTSMFVHGGLFHVGGNMLYLWIFGDNVEDAMGRGRFLVFYLLCGGAAAAAQSLANPASSVPMVGASGAVSGALGAYLILYPNARVWTLIIFGFFWRVVPIPALIVLGFWIVVQVLNGLLTFGHDRVGGVAFLAHIGGFVAGMILVNVLRQRSRILYRRI